MSIFPPASTTPGPAPLCADGAGIYRAVFTDGFDCMAISDNGVIVDVNQATLRIFGYTREELIGRQILDLVAPESRPAVRAAIASNLETNYEMSFLRKDGSRFEAEALGRAVIHGGKLLRLTALRDLTERRSSAASLHDYQHKLELAMQMARLGHWELDVATQRFTFDDNFLRLLGTSAELEGSRTMLAEDYAKRFIPAEEITVVRREIEAAIAAADPHYQRQLEHPFCRVDGSLGVMLVNISIVKDATGRTVRTYGINQDVSERRQEEEYRARLEEQLQHAQKMDALGTLAGGIAHDFNNILTGLLGHLQLAALDLPDDHPSRASLREAGRAGRRARDLVGRILAFGRRSQHDWQPRPLGPVVQEAMQLLRASLPATIEMRTEIAPGLPAVLCDSAQIHQVLMNLGTNAAHAMRDQPGLLSVTLEPLAPTAELLRRYPQVRPDHTLRLTVRDTGVGIADEVLPRIFEPFFTTKPTGEGTGLGLTMVYSIVQSHQGAIVVESARGVGTTFVIYLPAATNAVAPHAAPSPTSTPFEAFGRGRTVLVVDDDPAVRHVSERMLQRLGFTVTAFENPLAALEDFRRGPGRFCAVLSDLTMPGMTGNELAAQLTTLRPDLPVLLTSGYVHKLSERAAWSSGVKHIIKKPFEIGELATRLRAIVDSVPA